MSGEGLVELARRYVACSDELEALRGEIRKAVLNGVGGEDRAAPFTRPARVLSGVQRANLVGAQAAEARIVELLKERPSLKTGAIAAATGSNVQTTADRLKRLRKRGAIGGGGVDGWTAASL